MNLKFIFILSLLLISLPINAQEGWFWQNPLPQGNDLNDVFALDTNIVFAVGDLGTIIKSTNGGISWDIQLSNTAENLYSVHFPDYNIGWTVGFGGIILKTTDSGETWVSQNSGTESNLWTVQFVNKNVG